MELKYLKINLSDKPKSDSLNEPMVFVEMVFKSGKKYLAKMYASDIYHWDKHPGNCPIEVTTETYWV